MPPFVGVRIELGRKAAVGFWRDNRGDVPFVEVGAQPVGIEGTVGKQVIGGKFLDQFRHRAEVMRLPRQQAEIDKVSKRVGEGQYLGRDAAARAAYGLALSPPFAPWPERCTLTIEPSIIAYSKSASTVNALKIL